MSFIKRGNQLDLIYRKQEAVEIERSKEIIIRKQEVGTPQ